MSGTRGLRVLSLHGYHGSAAVLRSQMAPLVSVLPANLEFVYVDAPSRATGDFGWWHDGFRGWERTLAWATEFFESQPRFDGLFGFSQGAALTGLLAAVNESTGGRDSGGTWFDFAVMVGGFKSDLPLHADLFKEGLVLPSAHIMGRSDGIVPVDDSRELARAFVDPVVLEHPGGHVVPGMAAVADPLARFLATRAEATSRNTADQGSRFTPDRPPREGATHG
jgi:hypothetical protein